MIDLTQDAIQVLLDHPKGEGMIVSCYADTSVTEGFVSLWSQHLKNEASAIEQRLAHDHQARARFAKRSRDHPTRARGTRGAACARDGAVQRGRPRVLSGVSVERPREGSAGAR